MYLPLIYSLWFFYYASRVGLILIPSFYLYFSARWAPGTPIHLHYWVPGEDVPRTVMGIHGSRFLGRLPLVLAHRSSPEANTGQILNHRIKLSSLDYRLWASLPAVDQQQLWLGLLFCVWGETSFVLVLGFQHRIQSWWLLQSCRAVWQLTLLSQRSRAESCRALGC